MASSLNVWKKNATWTWSACFLDWLWTIQGVSVIDAKASCPFLLSRFGCSVVKSSLSLLILICFFPVSWLTLLNTCQLYGSFQRIHFGFLVCLHSSVFSFMTFYFSHYYLFPFAYFQFHLLLCFWFFGGVVWVSDFHFCFSDISTLNAVKCCFSYSSQILTFSLSKYLYFPL